MKKTKHTPKPINNDPMYWVNNYNIAGIIEGFSYMHSVNVGFVFEGDVNILIFDRRNLPAIKRHMKKYLENLDMFLDGFLPKGISDFWDEDFLLTPSSIIPTNILKMIIDMIQDKVFLLTVRCVVDSKTNHTNVLLNMN